MMFAIRLIATACALLLIPHAVCQQIDSMSSNTCRPDLGRTAAGNFSVRLDGKRNAYLLVHDLAQKEKLFIVQYRDSHMDCGYARDSVESTDVSLEFELECRDKAHLSQVIVALRHSSEFVDNQLVQGKIVRSWAIDSRALTFKNVDSRRVECSTKGYAGADTGEDLITRARKRSRQQYSNTR